MKSRLNRVSRVLTKKMVATYVIPDANVHKRAVTFASEREIR